MGRHLDAEADFVGAVQVFDAALACGTADGMVRLWDLRSGQVHRSLVGHTGSGAKQEEPLASFLWYVFMDHNDDVLGD